MKVKQKRRKRLRQTFRFAYRERQKHPLCTQVAEKPILLFTQSPPECLDRGKEKLQVPLPRISDRNFLGKSTTDRRVIRCRLGESRASGNTM
ncbi:hypothetical protein PUN28_006812 [Cardiocondyla obscurior]|uniref:Uncharacterized protein n=1 Tax=Cardiocondyla obscurior TaxID=286306 RepID=A0AAW2G202_9HYME